MLDRKRNVMVLILKHLHDEGCVLAGKCNGGFTHRAGGPVVRATTGMWTRPTSFSKRPASC